MKMSKEDFNKVKTLFLNNKETVEAHYQYVKEQNKYKLLEVKVAYDCLVAFVGRPFIHDQYSKGLNDTHITTGCVKALKEVLNS